MLPERVHHVAVLVQLLLVNQILFVAFVPYFYNFRRICHDDDDAMVALFQTVLWRYGLAP